ncbi:hypothetical protein CFK40_05185 [Virgibacillus necropolis]|uniref:Uncharacterized protein n=1 Tax=Virgibacillus necropolis TaxID=163877 RepID=A0A221M9W2_9BACI|nr:hypothetical protein CFK40_05185 [Virgibacillus necropolis]
MALARGSEYISTVAPQTHAKQNRAFFKNKNLYSAGLCIFKKSNYEIDSVISEKKQWNLIVPPLLSYPH